MSFDSEHRPLRQYGFEEDCKFASLASSNRFLFRVHSPRFQQHQLSITSHVDPESIFALAQKFDRSVHSTPAPLPVGEDVVSSLTYDDCKTHMDWTTRSSSPFVSASFSFSWALWDALRRYKENVKHDVQITVIDAFALRAQAVTAAQLLEMAPSDEELPSDHSKWRRYAQDSQTVLVHGYIPNSAVFTSIPFLSIVPDLPSYFLQYTPNSRVNNPLSNIVASLGSGKAKGTSRYRHFCTSMVDHYECLPPDVRLREATVGTVRTAMTLLLPWFEQAVSNAGHSDSYAAGIRKTSQLAWTLACWAENRSGLLDELYDVIQGIVQQLAEQIRKRKLSELEHSAKVEQLHWAIMEMEMASQQMFRQHQEEEDDRLNLLTPIPEDEDDVLSDSDGETVVHTSPPTTPHRKGSLSPSLSPRKMPKRALAPLFSPMMGLDTPMPNTDDFSFNMLGPPIELKPPHAYMIPLPPSPLLESPPASPTLSDVPLAETPSPRPDTRHRAECSFARHHQPTEEDEDADDEESELGDGEDMTLVHVEAAPCDLAITIPAVAEVPSSSKPRLEFIDEEELDEESEYLPRANPFRPRGLFASENLGCLVSGFLVGAMVAVSVISANQRRMLLTHLT